MPDVKVSDVILVPWRDGTHPTVQIVQRGDPTLPQEAQLSGALTAKFPDIRALATVTVRGSAGDDVSLWRFGFIQLSFIHHDWAHYRGDSPTEGSVFVARDRPPAMSNNICRDSVAEIGLRGMIQRFPFIGPIIFYDPETPIKTWWNRRVTGYTPLGTKIPASGTLVFEVLFSDSPSPRWWGLNRVNQTAHQENNIYSLQYGHAFATMFAFQKGPGQPIKILRSFEWNVRWRAHFRRRDAFNVEQAPRPGDLMDMNISAVVNGPPNEPRFQSSIFDTTLPNCNDQQFDASDHPVIRKLSKWEDWKVSH